MQKILYLKFYTFLFISTILIFSCKNTSTGANSEELSSIGSETAEAFDQRMEWWRDATYGMFIHWGVYALPAGKYKGEEVKGIGEWIMKHGQIPISEYEEFAKAFNPVDFDADAWAEIMADAGMKYVVITSKHHDGFCLWDSDVTDYDVIDYTDYDKDILADLSKACKERGIMFGTYYSIMDWHHPDAQANTFLGQKKVDEADKTSFARYLEEYLKPQIKELITRFDVDIMWFDGEWIEEFTHDQGKDLYQYVRALKPSILINNRVDKGRAGMQGMNKDGDDYAGDFGTPEQEVLEGTSDFDWESCMTMNDTWGYKSSDHNWKSTEQLLYNLVDVAAKGGNYLLNVGPDAQGLIPAPSVERLQAIGNWLDINGEAIYGTKKLQGFYKQGEMLRFTKSKDEQYLYAIVMDIPDSGVLEIENIIARPESVINILGHDNPLEWSQKEQGNLVVNIDSAELDKGFVVLKIKGEESI